MTINTLLVEDDQRFAEDMVIFLNKDVEIVNLATNKPDAINLIKKKEYDLLICDTELADGPKANKYGIDVASKFRKANPGSIIIGMSGDNNDKKYWKGHCNYFWDKDIYSIQKKSMKTYFRL